MRRAGNTRNCKDMKSRRAVLTGELRHEDKIDCDIFEITFLVGLPVLHVDLLRENGM